ncbi:MAG: X-Pro dipeptidyl-peptidase, partial [Gemmatimonadetes bacterium]
MRLSICLIAALLAAPPASRAEAQQPPADSAFVRTEAMIPARDGIHLFTVVVAPRRATAPLPILMTRTPYGARGAPGVEGYIRVVQDIRGRYGSEGGFDMNRPPHSGPAGTDESTDTYDTIDWLVKNVPNNNGKVGVLGVSYPGWLAAVAGIGAHPALKAISPQAPMGDTWMGDDFFHQGAFRLTYGLGATPNPGRYDTFEWYLSFPTLGALAQAVGADRRPIGRRFAEHPSYDTIWRARSLPRYFPHSTVPTLVVGGWWDQEDEYGPLATYASLEKTDTPGLVHLVMGPWYHGQWSGDAGTQLGNVRFGRATGADYRALEGKWFGYWLKGEGDGKLPEATVFDAGSNEWRSFDQWPPKEAVRRKLYF